LKANSREYHIAAWTRLDSRRHLVKRILVLASIAVLAVAATSYAQLTNVIAGGPHDLSNGSALRNTDATINGQTCLFCHVPHGGNSSIPLWNRSPVTGAGYQLYSSTTTSSIATVAGVTNGVSGACMSCHDGSIAVDVLLNVNGTPRPTGFVSFTRQGTAKATYSNSGSGLSNLMVSGPPTLGSDLRNDHPVAITYELARAQTPAEFVTQTLLSGTNRITVGTTNGLPLFAPPGATGTTANATVECASCHNAHSNTLGNFLRKANTGSAICLTCHIK
jgi:predicted CXXCH cytochrome family protein